MLGLGFDNGWVELVMRCVSFVSYSFILNGQVQGALTPSRGIRQGDPLSPYLFVICAHGFSELLINFERQNLFKGVKIAPSCPSITHLFFADDSLIFCRAKRADCFQLRQCLVLYEKASGQSINFDKSALSFSPNTGEMDREEICAMFGVTQVEGHDMYLGVPTFSMRNKRLQFGYIRDRVFKKLQGWKEKKFSQGGKEVLLKAVIQAIPIYAMSYYIISDGIVKEIEAACERFSWGTTSDHKRVHWINWKDLCKPKSLGGMGFRDLSVFNQAMLGKQVWRLVTRPSSLAAKVLKAKYYPNSSIWEADANDSSSYTWKSILWGLNLVAQGTRWRVGNGESISIYQSRWVPIPWSFRISSPAVLPATLKVSDLLQEDESWNDTLIRSSFLEFEADTILNLPRPSSRAYDSYCWHYESKGSYSVKSGFIGFAMTVWQSWNLRNKLKHDGESSLLGHDLQSVEAQLETYQRSRSAAASASLTSFVNGKIWHAPPPSHFRLDVDTSYSIVSGTYGVGGVIRDCSSVLIVASC
ncbi:hypothetical protein UlMin_019228 [Ulmus minor]